MGITHNALKILLEEKKRSDFSGSVLTLGNQDVSFTKDELFHLAKKYNQPLSVPGVCEFTNKPLAIRRKFISCRYLLSSLGFSAVRSMDVSSYENADILFDLNSSSLPSDLRESFDVIIDAGTLEHVFHFPNAMKNIFSMLKVGGRIIHIAPSSNYIDHGFYMFSPTVFYDFYSANRFDIPTIRVIRHTPFHRADEWEASEYKPGCLNAVCNGGLDDGMYGIVCVAVKSALSTGDAIPQQSACQNVMWNPSSANQPSTWIQSALHSSHPAINFLRTNHFLRKFCWKMYKFFHSFQKKGLRLPISKRY